MATSRSGDGTNRSRENAKTNEPGFRSPDDSSPPEMADTGAGRGDDKARQDRKNAEGGRRDDQSGTGPSASGRDPGKQR